MAEITLSTNKREASGQVSRREFLRNVGLIASGAAIGSMAMLSTQTKTTTVMTLGSTTTTTVTASSRPETKGATLSEVLRNRKSASAFQPQPLSKEKLLELLWAAWGINRPDSGKRTAPTAMNTQEIDIYILLPDGVYVYDAKGNQLTLVLAQDLRTKTGSGGAVRDAPVHLLFVADYAKYRAIPQSQKELYSAAHTGFIGQNVYLYCASEGLGARFYAGIDRATLKDLLKLRNDQAIVFAQAVGYAKE